jgi:hypothetical protein
LLDFLNVVKTLEFEMKKEILIYRNQACNYLFDVFCVSFNDEGFITNKQIMARGIDFERASSIVG